ncbi:hypothetical protein GN956_G2228 [Arapaima gigas]
MRGTMQVQSFGDSVVPSKMPRILRPVGEMSFHGFSTLKNLPRFTHEEAESILSSSIGEKEGKDISTHWNPSKSYLQTNRSPGVNTSVTNRSLLSQVPCRPEHMTITVDKKSYLEKKDLTPGQKLTFLNQLPEPGSPSALGDHLPVPLRKLPIGGANVSQQTDFAGLAIPKPVYGQKACCVENLCSSGPLYSIEHGGSQINASIFNQELMSEYGQMSLLQRKEHEAMMQRQVLDHRHRLPLQEAQADDYHAMRYCSPIKLPAFLEPNYHSFPYMGSACSVISPSVGQYHSLRFPTKMYHSFPVSSSSTFEEMQQMTLSHSDKIYTEHISDGLKHTQRSAYPSFHYMQASLNVPSSALYSDVRENQRHELLGSLNKQSTPAQYLVPHPASDEVLPSCPVSPSHSDLNSYEVSAYQLYKMQSSAGQKRTFPDGPVFTLPHAEQTEDYSLKKLLSSSGGLCRQAFGSGAFHRVQPRFDQRSSSESPKLNDRLTSPNGSVHNSIDHYQTETGRADLDLNDSDLSSLYTEGNEKKLSNTNVITTECLKQMDSDNILEDNVLVNPKIEEINKNCSERPDVLPSPPMPVIHSVFSLAPYKAYLDATGGLPAQNILQSGHPQSDICEIKPGRQNLDNDSQQELQESKQRLKPTVLQSVSTKEFQQIKTEENADEITNSFEAENQCKEVPKEAGFLTAFSDFVLDLSIRKSESDESACKRQKLTHCSEEYTARFPKMYGPVDAPELNCSNGSSILQPTGPQQSISSPRPLNTEFWFQQAPHKQPKLSAFKFVLPDAKLPSDNATKAPFQSLGPKLQPKLLVGPMPNLKSSRRVLHHFMELHQLLCRLISTSVSNTPEGELRAWLDKSGLGLPVSSVDKTQSISSLLRVAVKESWLRCNDIVEAFQQVISQLKGFVSTHKCPFPHVVRAGMLFIPILVVKESLFPQVPGTSIDQVLQELRVELRPTTLSEERHFTKLQGRACSSKLRRLLSLKHLPDVYPDALNLFYHICVSKHLGAELGTTVKKEQVLLKHCEDYTAKCPQSKFLVQDSPKHLKNKVYIKKQKRNSKRKNVSRSLLSEGDLQYQHSDNWSIVKSLTKDAESSQGTFSEDLVNIKIKTEQDSPNLEQAGMEVPDSAWGPVMSDDCSVGSDTDTERTSTFSCQSQSSTSSTLPVNSHTHSGMILKLRKVLFKKDPIGCEANHQRVCKTGRCGQPAHTGVHSGNRNASVGRNFSENAWTVHPKVAKSMKSSSSETQKSTRSSKALQLCHSTKSLHLRRSTKSMHLRRSMVQIKYCSYLSASHTTQRRRWVLRSAVRTARQAMKDCYPELVGKRICHLYEEKDKSEVWYKGIVVRVHEPHPNPLKVVFEVKYDSEPEWQYYLELLMDYKKGWLKVED